MNPRQPRSTRTDTLFPDTTRFRSWKRPSGTEQIAFGKVLRERRGKRLAKSGAKHDERCQDVALDVNLEPLPRYPFDDIGTSRRCVIRIGWRRARCVDPVRHTALQPVPQLNPDGSGPEPAPQPRKTTAHITRK